MTEPKGTQPLKNTEKEVLMYVKSFPSPDVFSLSEPNLVGATVYFVGE